LLAVEEHGSPFRTNMSLRAERSNLLIGAGIVSA
jgi:hypothetical protein